MNRTQQLKLLNEEIRRLFFEGISEQDAFDRLQSDTRFDSIRRNSIQSLYKKLQKDVDKKARQLEEQNRQLEEQNRQLEEQNRQLEELNRQLEERKQMIQYQQNAKQFFIYEGSLIEENHCFMGVWQGRYFVTENIEHQDERKIKLYDFLQNISKEISFQLTGLIYEINFLSDNFILLFVSNALANSIHLAQIDLVSGTLHFVQNVEFQDMLCFLLDSSNRSKFLVLRHSANEVFSVVLCKFVSGSIEIGEEIVLENLISSGSVIIYSNDQLFVLKNNGREEDMSDASMVIQNLDAEKRRNTLKLKSLPSNVYRDYDGDQAWSNNHFFISIQFRLTGKYSVAFTNFQTCDWTILKFAIDLPIRNLSIVNRCDLVVCAQGSDSIHSHVNLYKLSLRKPDTLRNKAWIKTVSLFKKRQFADPYEEARKFLPLNSDIRGPFAADQGEIE